MTEYRYLFLQGADFRRCPVGLFRLADHLFTASCEPTITEAAESVRGPRPIGHSARNASTAGIDAARRAGIIAATDAHSASAPAAIPSATGSQVLTPYNCA